MCRPTRRLILLSISIILVFLIGRNFIFSSGYIYLAEQFESYTVHDFWRVVHPIWNEKLQLFPPIAQPKLYLYAPFSLMAGMLGSYKLLQVLLLLLPYPIAFISSFKLTVHIISKSVDEKILEKYIFFSAITAAFVFTVNPWFAMNSRNVVFRMDYAFLPLLVYLFVRLLESKSANVAIYFAAAMALVGGYRYTFLVTLMLAVVFLSYVILSKKGGWREHISELGWVCFAYILFALLSMAKFLPAILHSRFVPVRAVEQFNLNMVKRGTLLYIFSTKIYEWTAVDLDLVYSDMTHFFFIPVTAFAFTYLLYNFPKKRKNYFYLIFPPLLFVLFVLLSARELNVDLLILNLPFSDFLGRLLRHARWNVMPIILSLSIMLGFSTAFLLSKIGKRAYLLLVAILVLTSVSSWPVFTGDMNGYWRATQPPQDYVKVNNLLKGQNGDHHALWFPGALRRAVWSNQTGVSEASAPMGIFPIRSSAKPSYSTRQYYFFDYYNPLRGGPGMSPLPVYKGNLSEVYSPLNVKYVMLHYDGGWVKGDRRKGFTNTYIRHVADEIGGSSLVHELHRGKYISAFQLRNDAKEFQVRSPFLVKGKLTTLGSITALQEGRMPGVVFGNASIDTPGKNIPNYPLVITDTRQLLLFEANATMIYPKKFSKRFAPREMWSPSSVDHSGFQNSLLRKGIEWNWQFDYGKGLVFTWAPETGLSISFNVDEGDDFKVFIRFFENQEGGSLNVSLDGMLNRIYTKDQLNRFVWEDLGTYNLKKGKHELTLENVEGFNAVNLFVLIPEGEYKEAEAQFIRSLQNKRVIYLFEAESDIYRENSKISDRFGGEASNGRVLRLGPKGRAWQEVEVLKEGSYKIAVQGIGRLDISIDGKTYHLDSRTLDLTYFGPFELEKGKYIIEVTPSKDARYSSQTKRALSNEIWLDDVAVWGVEEKSELYLDVIWLYSAKNNETLQHVFSSDDVPAEVVSYEKINSTKYKVHVKASAPYMLSFAEGYDPLWVAEIGTPKGIKQYEPVPLYSVINGFWIDELGEHTVTIRYKPQDWFEIGSVISALTLFGCIGYLVYDGRRKRRLKRD